MISECSETWITTNARAIVDEVQSNCDQARSTLPPVTDGLTGFVYRNEYCALCNGVNVDTTILWRYNLLCQPELRALVQNNSEFMVTQDTLSEYCTVGRFDPPFINITLPPPRRCVASIDTCLDVNTLENITNIEWNMTLYEVLSEQCTGSILQNLVVDDNVLYRNQECARCNGIPPTEPVCFFESAAVDIPGPSDPFSVLLDILGSGRVATLSEVVTSVISVTCSETEVFDPVLMMCRQTILLQSIIGMNQMFGQNDTNTCNGSLIDLNAADIFTLLNTNTILYNNEIYTIKFNTSEGNPVICIYFSRNGTQEVNNTLTLYSYPQAFFILTYIGCSLSVIGSVLVLITYSIFKELRTLPSKILMNLTFAILVSNLLILLGGPIVAAFPDVVEMCAVVGILLHFFFLSQFSWMSLMLSEMARIFYRAERFKMEESKKRKNMLLMIYLFVGWSTPLLITTITIVINYTKDGLVLYGVLPDGSRGSCWINHVESAVVAFVTPLAVSLIFNCITFTTVSVLLCRASRSQAKLNKEGNSPVTQYLRIMLAVFSVSGLAWIFGFLAILAGTSWAWYPFIVLNSTQGFIIFIAFLFTKHIGKLYINLFTCKTDKVHSQTTSIKMLSVSKKFRLTSKSSAIS